MIRFLFRQPKFPVICDAQGVLIGAETPGQLSDQVQSIRIPACEEIPLVDASSEGWVLDIDHMIVSPLTLKKVWTKKEIIAMFNKSKTAAQAGLEYPARSLSSKRFDRIIAEIVKLLLNTNTSLRRTGGETGARRVSP
jgi:hypothetical protein